MNTRLALDVGTNSLGWALYQLDDGGEPESIIDVGVRIFSDGRDEKSLASLAADRRIARGARRRRDRFLQRQNALLHTLVLTGLMPDDETERHQLATIDPYSLRKKALDEQLHPHHVGRAIFHLNQRRGFKSNRKTDGSGDNEAGVVKQSIKQLKEKLKAEGKRTIGEYLAERQADRQTVRARRFGTKGKDLYELYPDRAMLEEEFDKIWEMQAEFDPQQFHEDAKNKVKRIIFHQRPLKPQQVGKCTFIPTEDRIAKALPSYQRYRIYSDIHNLAWIDENGKEHPVTNNQNLRDHLVKELETKEKLTFVAIAGILKRLKVTDENVTFNFRTDDLLGNKTSCLMRNAKKILGKHIWDELDEDKKRRYKEDIKRFWDEMDDDAQDSFISLLLDDEADDLSVKNQLMTKYHLPEDWAEGLLNIRLPDGHGSLSKMAIDAILPVMRDQGLQYYDAVKEAGFGEANLYDPDALLSDRLAYYGKALEGHVIGASGQPHDRDERRYGKITNPTVHIALNQIRAVVNEIIRRYGKPHEIALEIARDLPVGAEGKREIEKKQKEGRNRNQRISEELQKIDVANNRENRQKYQLWEELSDDPLSRYCPFTGKNISVEQLFSPQIEIEHLLPYSKTLDNGMSNKTVCFSEANRLKGKRSPHEAFGHSPEGYSWPGIIARANQLPKSKFWRFQPDAMERFENEEEFLDRQLGDTRYIARYTRKYLCTIIPENKIWVATGRHTHLLRQHLGLEGLFRDHNQQDAEPEAKPVKKSRDDHRHHAVDALVIGLISRSMLQKISRAARRAEETKIEKLFQDDLTPWAGFREEAKTHIDHLIVSHRPRKKTQGQLHKDTAYGLVGDGQVVYRKAISAFTDKKHIGEIRDQHIRDALWEEARDLSGPSDISKAVENWCRERSIRRLRVIKNLSVIPIKDKTGKDYKGVQGGSNAYIDIYICPKTGKWQGEVISMFDANQAGFIPDWQKKIPTPTLRMRLRINDMVRFTQDDDDTIYRVQKISQAGSITLSPHNEANVDKRNRDNNDLFKFTNISPSSMQKKGAVKLYISPTGLIREG